MASLTPRLDSIDTNLIINGSMDFWQRGTTFTASTNVYGADRWKHNIISSHYQVLRSTNIPSVENVAFSLQADCLAVASPAAADQEMIEQFIEGNLAKKLVGRKARLVFWVSSPKTGTHNLYIITSSSTNSMLLPYTVTAANTWQKVVLDVDFTSVPTTLLTGSSAALVVGFPLAIGTNRVNASSNIWLSGDFKILSGAQSNLLDNTANNFYVTGVMLMPYNSMATPSDPGNVYTYAGRDIIRELQLCQRYYEKSYAEGVNPAAINNTNLFYNRVVLNGTSQVTQQFMITKRASASVTTYSPNTGATGVVRNVDTGADIAATVNFQNSINFEVGMTPVGNNVIAFHWTAEAEL